MKEAITIIVAFLLDKYCRLKIKVISKWINPKLKPVRITIKIFSILVVYLMLGNIVVQYIPIPNDSNDSETLKFFIICFWPIAVVIYGLALLVKLLVFLASRALILPIWSAPITVIILIGVAIFLVKSLKSEAEEDNNNK